jgi:hypothetical protein
MRPIYLLLDVTGSGKSTVAKQMADKWTENGQLFVWFFFSHDVATTKSTDSFCSMVANALAGDDSTFKASTEAFKKHKDFDLLSFKEWFQGLVAKPLEKLGQDTILIINALDKCDNKYRKDLLNTSNPPFCNFAF